MSEPLKKDGKPKLLKEPWCSTKEILHMNIHSIDRISSIIDRKKPDYARWMENEKILIPNNCV
jgi:hypothetical protein